MVSLVRLPHGSICHPDVHVQWDMVNSHNFWFAGKVRGKKGPPVGTVIQIWLEIAHTLRGQYDAIRGSLHKAIRKRLAFQKVWQHSPFYTLQLEEKQWQYAQQKQLFPPFLLSQHRARMD